MPSIEFVNDFPRTVTFLLVGIWRYPLAGGISDTTWSAAMPWISSCSARGRIESTFEKLTASWQWAPQSTLIKRSGSATPGVITCSRESVRQALLNLRKKRSQSISSTISKESDIDLSRGSQPFMMWTRMCDGKMFNLYSLRNTYRPVQALKSQIMNEATWKYLLWRSNYGRTNTVL